MPTQSARTAPAALALMLAAGSAWADQLHVPAQYPTIQSAIDAAVDGDEIVIAPGTYRELLDGRNKSLTYTGAGMGLTVLSGDLDADGTPDGTVLRVNTTNVTEYPRINLGGLSFRDCIRALSARRLDESHVVGCEFSGATESGIHIDQARATLTLRGSVAHGNALSLRVNRASSASHELRIEGCQFFDNAKGVLVFYSDTVIQESSFAQHTEIALHINYDGADVALIGNTFRDNSATSVVLLASPSVVSTASIDTCTFEDNHTSRGSDYAGALWFQGFDVSVLNSHFRRNSSPLAAAVLAQAPSTFAGCSFVDNGLAPGATKAASSQCAILVQSTIQMTDCDFRGNLGWAGAAIYKSPIGSGLSRLIKCSFFRNTSHPTPGLSRSGRGGAVYAQGPFLLIDECEFRENSAVQGGAIYEEVGGPPLRVSRSKFYANHVRGTGSQGGAISTQFRTQVTGCLFVGNSAPDGSSGVIHGNFIPTVDASVFVDNSAASGDVCNTTLFNYDITNSVIMARDLDSTIVNTQSSIPRVPVSSESILTDTPETIGFVRLPDDGGDGWGDNPSTPNLDESLNDDYGDLRLTSGSPAIDAGLNATIWRDQDDFDADGDTTEPITGEFDIDGNPRFVDASGMPNIYPGTSVGGPIDLGPYEFQGVSCWADVNADGTLSPADFSAWINAFNTNRTRADQNRDGDLTPADFSAWVANYNAGC